MVRSRGFSGFFPQWPWQVQVNKDPGIPSYNRDNPVGHWKGSQLKANLGMHGIDNIIEMKEARNMGIDNLFVRFLSL